MFRDNFLLIDDLVTVSIVPTTYCNYGSFARHETGRMRGSMLAAACEQISRRAASQKSYCACVCVCDRERERERGQSEVRGSPRRKAKQSRNHSVETRETNRRPLPAARKHENEAKAWVALSLANPLFWDRLGKTVATYSDCCAVRCNQLNRACLAKTLPGGVRACVRPKRREVSRSKLPAATRHSFCLALTLTLALALELSLSLVRNLPLQQKGPSAQCCVPLIVPFPTLQH